MADLNHKYWEKMTIFSSARYCKKMLELSGNPYENCRETDFDEEKLNNVDETDSKYVKYMKDVIEFNRRHALRDHLEELEAKSPFPSDLMGVIHEYNGKGIFQPIHLMCKLAAIRVKSMGITFEFLIEYGLLESDVEIYYGIKAISDYEYTTDEFERTVFELSLLWFKIAGTKVGKKYMKFYQNLKYTNNTHDGTFWIAWGRMNSDEEWAELIDSIKNKLYDQFDKFIEAAKATDEAKGMGLDISVLNEDYYDCSGYYEIKNQLKQRYSAPASIKESNPFEDLCSKNKKIEKDIKDFVELAVKFPKNEPILKDNENGTYTFMIDNKDARAFIELLFNSEKIKLVKKYYKEYFGRIDREDSKGAFFEKNGHYFSKTNKDFANYLLIMGNDADQSVEKRKDYIQDYNTLTSKKNDHKKSWPEIKKVFFPKDSQKFKSTFETSGYDFDKIGKWVNDVMPESGRKSN